MSNDKGFIKTASVQTLAVATYGTTGFQRTAAYEDQQNSAYIGGSKPIDIKAALQIVASEYDLSNNPEPRYGRD